MPRLTMGDDRLIFTTINDRLQKDLKSVQNKVQARPLDIKNYELRPPKFPIWLVPGHPPGPLLDSNPRNPLISFPLLGIANECR